MGGLGASPRASASYPQEPRKQVPRATLTNKLEYDHSDSTLFPMFIGKLEAQVEQDYEAHGGEQGCCWHAFGCLQGQASTRIFPWMEAQRAAGTLTLGGLIAQIKVAFADPHRQDKALATLQTIKQGTQSFDEFMNQFDRLLLEAGLYLEGDGSSDRMRKSLLKPAVSIKIRKGTLGMLEEPTYTGYCQQLRAVHDQLVEMKEIDARGASYKPATRWESYKKPSSSDNMEWEPTKAGKTREKSTANPRAKSRKDDREAWGSAETVDKRKREGCCLRCGMEGHFVRDCFANLERKKKKVAKSKPAASVTQTGKVKRTKMVEVTDSEASDSEVTSEEGKE